MEKSAWQGTVGLEIGGPSSIFQRDGALPIYPIAARIDNLDYAPTTLWNTERAGVPTSAQPGGDARRSLVGDATRLEGIGSGSYDFLLASHVLEHLANPGRALRQWRRVLRPGGSMLLVVPDRRWTFDHRRPTTPVEHLISDERAEVGEGDVTHVPEILRLHDRRLDRPDESASEFADRIRRNIELRSAHHHVFERSNLGAFLETEGFQVRYLETRLPLNLICAARAALG